MEDLNYEIQDFIEVTSVPLKKEYAFIKKSDWTTAEKLKDRILQHSLSAKVTDNAMDTAKTLSKLAVADLKHKEVKKMLTLCKKIFELYEKRYHKYVDDNDWSTFLGEGKDLNEAEAELKFQLDLRKELGSFKAVLRGINFGDDARKVDIPTFNNAAIPLFMREMAEDKFPEIQDLLNQTEEPDVISKPRKSSRKNTKLPK